MKRTTDAKNDTIQYAIMLVVIVVCSILLMFDRVDMKRQLWQIENPQGRVKIEVNGNVQH